MILDILTNQPCEVIDLVNEMGNTVFIVRLEDGETARRVCGEIKYVEEGGEPNV